MHAYEIYSDSLCRNQIIQDQVNLEDGDNFFYLVVRSIINSSVSWTFPLIVKRDYAKRTVTFNSNYGVMGTKEVKDGTTLKESDIVVDKDYVFVSTDFDFTRIIIEDTVVYVTVDYK